MINNLVITALIVCFLFESTFFLSLGLIYNSIEKKNLRILNTFIFETTPSFKEKNGVLNYFLFFSLLVNAFPFIFYASRNINVYSVSMMILAVLTIFCLATLPFVSLNKLKEHFYLFFGALLCMLALSGVEAFYSYYLYKTYLDNYALASMIVSIVLAFILLLIVFNPKLFDLQNKKNDDGSFSRKRFIFLAFSEWLLYPGMILSLVPILLITMK